MKKNVDSDHEGGSVVRLTIDAETDTYEQAIAAVQTAYGLRPVTPANWPEPPPVDPRPGPQELGDDDIGDREGSPAEE